MGTCAEMPNSKALVLAIGPVALLLAGNKVVLIVSKLMMQEHIKVSGANTHSHQESFDWLPTDR